MERRKICLFAYCFMYTSQLSNAWTIHQPMYSTRIRKHITSSTVLLASKIESDTSDEAKEIQVDETKLKNITTEYKRPVFSDSFRKHMEQVRASFPSNDEGVDCTGEPSMDPSRIIGEGIDSEYLNDY
ncbi:predicted protein [Chaetoceros tenuissimus]|uniref:Uncharacterized protein n=1 Tax=Chaetoceros tenuissimus TaxID=426638 RepID=A0AAD3CMH0_9STRA|nr:predicted protein [Chaetoceros tenuissimus]